MAQRQDSGDDLFDMDEFDSNDFLSEETSADQAVSDSGQQNEAAPEDDWLEATEVPGQLMVDVYQTKEDIYVIAPVPGVSRDDIDLSIVESTLTIRGARKEGEKVRTSDYFVQECYWGEFSRSIILPVEVKEEEAEAELKDGMLTVKIPKAEQDKVKKIDIA
jgi:HSP20 family protein